MTCRLTYVHVYTYTSRVISPCIHDINISMIDVCTKLTRVLACSAASGDEPGAGHRDYICSSFEAYCDPGFSSVSYYPER